MTMQVEYTNDSSCLSKCSAAKSGYFDDQFLRYFVNKCPRRAPLINLGYSVRAAIIISLIKKFIKSFCGPKQIVSLGAGFDTLYFKLKTDTSTSDIDFYEFDLPRVVKRKLVRIKNSNTLSQLIGNFVLSEDKLLSEDYKIFPLDLRDASALKEILQNRLKSCLPTLFLSECAITYLEEDRSSELISIASECLPHATFITYEQIHPHDGFGLVMLQHFQSLQSPLMSVLTYPTRDHQQQRYIQRGWDHCISLSALDAYYQLIPIEERCGALRLEPFDEWEEFYLKCLHYSVTISSKGSLAGWTKLSCTLTLPRDLTPSRKLNWEFEDIKQVSRYGHSIVSYKDKVLVIGGFGVQKNGTHGRMNNISWLERNFDKSEWIVNRETEAKDVASMYATWTPVSETKYIVYGGRTSPSQPTHVTPVVITVCDEGTLSSEPLVENFDKVSRWRHSAVLAKLHNMDIYVVFGGRTSDLEVLGDTWIVPLKSGHEGQEVKSVPILGDQPCTRFSHSAAVWKNPSGDDEMYVSGGLALTGPLGDVWRLQLASLEWYPLPVALVPRFGHSSLVHNDRLLLLGGVGSVDHYQPGVTVIDLHTHSSVEYQLPEMSPGRSLLLINHGHIVSEDKDILWTLGGGGNCFSYLIWFQQEHHQFLYQ